MVSLLQDSYRRKHRPYEDPVVWTISDLPCCLIVPFSVHCPCMNLPFLTLCIMFSDLYLVQHRQISIEGRRRPRTGDCQSCSPGSSITAVVLPVLWRRIRKITLGLDDYLMLAAIVSTGHEASIFLADRLVVHHPLTILVIISMLSLFLNLSSRLTRD
jgi:hypothetical protein